METCSLNYQVWVQYKAMFTLSVQAPGPNAMLALQYNVNTSIFQALIPQFGHISQTQVHGLDEAVLGDLVLEY